MQRDYAYLKTSTLSGEDYKAIADNALAYFRNSASEKPKYALPVLFQACAFFERLIDKWGAAQRETPAREVTDEEFYTDAFAEELNYFTEEYVAAMRGCLGVMESVHSLVPAPVSIAVDFLNPLNSLHSSIPMHAEAARAQVCEHALMLSLTYSHVPWTQAMYDDIVAWYPAALLLCPQHNIPPMAAPDMRTALDWALSIDDHPKRRFLTLCSRFDTLLHPTPEAAAQLSLPSGFSLP